MGRKKKLSPDRQSQVDTTLARYGEDHYSKIGQIGGKNNKSNTSEKGKMAVKVRWDKYRENQTKKELKG